MGFLKKLIKGIVKMGKKDLEKAFVGQEYLDEYRVQMDKWVLENPQVAIGGKWDEIGALQYEFLINQGLKPENTLLDLGCGTLRGGRHLIGYLNPGNYWGVDISPQAIRYAQELVKAEGLEARYPKLLVNETGKLTFDQFSRKTFDILLAQSVFTHLRPEHIQECFENIQKIFHQDTQFFFTYFEAPEFQLRSNKNFSYPLKFFSQLAEQNGFSLQDLSHRYAHPRNQKMARITLKAGRT